ncbi:HD domain-containing phosphohydrolase [Bordetella sp. LUAb4]|uniref:HD domain-containing phosphohydrolase n=1 Tax=Bordetella sp. LUAb4 TaxID=2843195 RepID=UPI001E616B0A|nr:HD domain-containing phosphohydrolase [Bordetella sp. LUAb4]
MASSDQMPTSRRGRRLGTHLALVFGATVLVAILGLVFYVHRQVSGMVEDASQTLFDHMANESRSQINRSISAADSVLQAFAADPQADDFASANQPAFIERLSILLRSSPFLSAFYVGYDDGGFVLLRRLTSPAARQALAAPATASYFLETVEGTRMTLSFLDHALKPVGEAPAPHAPFDPRTRDWYLAAKNAKDPQGVADATGATAAKTGAIATTAAPATTGAIATAAPATATTTTTTTTTAAGASILTDPYWFFVTNERGVTVARGLDSGKGVVGADLGLADLSQVLRQMKDTQSTALLLLNDHNQVLASSVPLELDASAKADAQPSWPASSIAPAMLAFARNAQDGQTPTGQAAHDGQTGQIAPAKVGTITHDDANWVIRSAPLQSGPWMFRIVKATPSNEMLAGARDLVSVLMWLGVAVAIIAMIVVRVASRSISQPLAQLAHDAERIQRFQFSPPPQEVRSSVLEVKSLSQSMRMASTTIQRFIEIGHALASERDPVRLKRRLLLETISVADADGGVLLMIGDGDGTLSVIDRDAPPDITESRPIARHDIDANVLRALTGKTVTYFDHTDHALTPFLASLVDARPLASTQVFRFWIVPLRNHSDEVMGALILAARIQTGAAPDASLDLVSALAGTAAMTMEMTRLLRDRKSLLDAVIRMIANSIDAKSPYTSGHCHRVPVLTTALVEAASQSRSAPFANFNPTEDEWEAIRVASWLHDCGKLVTAEYIVDKATKLETINDRIHEIRMRFELLKADAWTTYWRGVAEGGAVTALAQQRDAALAELDADYAFVAACNEGGEAMAPEDVERLRAIGDRVWMRTLDDRIGISRDEMARKALTPAATLPAREKLLDDRPDHLIAHHDSLLTELGAKAGFTLQRPEYRLNLGERYNLSIGRGTLTNEERYLINQHINHTIVMLEDLPLTGKMRHVPEYAGGHHEKMDGTGYPRGLRRDDMSVVARIMAIADVFEALTAADRPYKPGKKLSEAIRIMGAMKRDRHLDPDLLDLFLTSEVWRDYARQYMNPDLVDEPDIAAVLAITVAT